MIKIVTLWKRNPRLTEEECEEHYRTVHTALARKALENVPGFRRYIQNKVVNQTVYNFNDAARPEQVAPEYDRFVELYFDDMASLEKAMAAPEMQACLDDHPNFMDVRIPRSLVIYEVAERTVLEAGGPL